MDTLQKLNVLKEVYGDPAELDMVVDKLLEATLSDHRRHLQQYERALKDFEQRYALDSQTFYQRFEAGQMGDAMDFFEWVGLYELHQDLLRRIRRLEEVL